MAIPRPPAQKAISETPGTKAFQNPDLSDLQEVEQLPSRATYLESGGWAGRVLGQPDHARGK